MVVIGNITPYPRNPDQLFFCSKSSRVYVITSYFDIQAFNQKQKKCISIG